MFMMIWMDYCRWWCRIMRIPWLRSLIKIQNFLFRQFWSDYVINAGKECLAPWRLRRRRSWTRGNTFLFQIQLTWQFSPPDSNRHHYWSRQFNWSGRPAISILFGPLGFSRGLGDGKLPFSFFVLIFSRRWHTAMNLTSRTQGREELHRLRHPVPSPRLFQPRQQVNNTMLPPSTKSKCSLKSSVDVIWSCAVLLPTKRWSRCGECGNM